jgi:hypothetical protein
MLYMYLGRFIYTLSANLYVRLTRASILTCAAHSLVLPAPSKLIP